MTRLRRHDDEGQFFELHQRWTAPDGDIRREHVLRFSESEPGSYERYHYLTLPHDRYLEQTWTYNSETDTFERTFLGPNDQTWGGPQSEQAANAPGPVRRSFADGSPTAPREGMAAATPGEQHAGWGWGRFFREMNPFTNSTPSSIQPSVRHGRAGGFTVGTGASTRGPDRPPSPRITPAASALGGQTAGPRERPAHAAARPGSPAQSAGRSLPSPAAAARNR